jgi:hypothetical protein
MTEMMNKYLIIRGLKSLYNIRISPSRILVQTPFAATAFHSCVPNLPLLSFHVLWQQDQWDRIGVLL